MTYHGPLTKVDKFGLRNHVFFFRPCLVKITPVDHAVNGNPNSPSQINTVLFFRSSRVFFRGSMVISMFF